MSINKRFFCSYIFFTKCRKRKKGMNFYGKRKKTGVEVLLVYEYQKKKLETRGKEKMFFKKFVDARV